MQVVTNENMLEFIQNKSVPEFKPPAETKVEVKPEAKVETVKVDASPETKVEKTEVEKPRDDDGKFVKADDKIEAKAEVKTEADPDDDVKLTRKIEKLINRKHRQMMEAQEFGADEARRAIAAEQRAASLQVEIDKLKGTKSEGASGEPKPEDFKTVGEYTRALVKYEARIAGETSAKKQTDSRQQENAEKQVAAFVKLQDDFMAKTADYAEVLEDAPEVPPLASQFILESDVGPQVAYHLAKNPEVITRLHKLSPARVIAELAKLEAKLETPVATVTTATSSVSKAPAPIQPLEAKTTPVNKDPSQMSFQELRAFREAERRAKRA